MYKKVSKKVENSSKTLQARRYFLTIPKCDIGKENIKNLLTEHEQYLSHFMIGEELHVDKTKHYHIFLKYSKLKDFAYSHFDYLGKHGKLEACRNPRRAFIYISKEDKNPLANFDYEGSILSGTAEEIAMYLSQTGKRYEDLFKNNSNSLHLLTTKWKTIKNWQAEHIQSKKLAEIQAVRKGIRKIDQKLMKEVLTQEEYEMIQHNKDLQIIVQHINHVMEYKWKRPFKTKNILIWSEKPGVGKTSLIRKLMEHCPVYGFPRDQWFPEYQSGCFWGILWNETTLRGIDMERIKNFLEGTPVSFTLQGSKIVKEDNPEIFMTANWNLTDMVKEKAKADKKTLEALRERIDEVCVDKYENIFFLSKLIVPLGSEK